MKSALLAFYSLSGRSFAHALNYFHSYKTSASVLTASVLNKSIFRDKNNINHLTLFRSNLHGTWILMSYFQPSYEYRHKFCCYKKMIIFTHSILLDFDWLYHVATALHPVMQNFHQRKMIFWSQKSFVANIFVVRVFTSHIDNRSIFCNCFV